MIDFIFSGVLNSDVPDSAENMNIISSQFEYDFSKGWMKEGFINLKSKNFFLPFFPQLFENHLNYSFHYDDKKDFYFEEILKNPESNESLGLKINHNERDGLSTAEIKDSQFTMLYKLRSDYQTYLKLIISEIMNHNLNMKDLMDLKIDYANDCMTVWHAWEFFWTSILMEAKFCKTSTVIEFYEQVMKS